MIACQRSDVVATDIVESTETNRFAKQKSL